jgi:uncharacterized protein YidB (DUF937 family)
VISQDAWKRYERDNLLAALTQILPNVLDKLTPQGSIPTGGLLEQALSLFRSDDESAPQKP